MSQHMNDAVMYVLILVGGLIFLSMSQEWYVWLITGFAGGGLAQVWYHTADMKKKKEATTVANTSTVRVS